MPQHPLPPLPPPTCVPARQGGWPPHTPTLLPRSSRVREGSSDQDTGTAPCRCQGVASQQPRHQGEDSSMPCCAVTCCSGYTKKPKPPNRQAPKLRSPTHPQVVVGQVQLLKAVHPAPSIRQRAGQVVAAGVQAGQGGEGGPLGRQRARQRVLGQVAVVRGRSHRRCKGETVHT